MTDLTPNDLSHLSDEEFIALCPQGEHAPGPEPLSPAAQAVLDAVFDHWPGGYNHPGKPLCVAVAIRALADQVVPEGGAFLSPGTADGIRAHILAIATELEGQ
jgi:hypothetical protein